MKIVLNEDKEHVRLVREALRKNEGYCPCRLFNSEDSKCICKDFKEQDSIGYCQCGLYKKVED